MSIKDLKFTEVDFVDKDIASLPDRPSDAGITAAQLKARFDMAPKVMVALGSFNELIDDIQLPNAGDDIGVDVNAISEKKLNSALSTLKNQIDIKEDKVPGKGLSTEDFTADEKAKLSEIDENANNYSLPIAAADKLGGVKVGVGMSISGDGTLTATAAPAPDLIAREAISSHTMNGDNPHNVTTGQIGAATATQGEKADAALPKAGGTLMGEVIAGGTQSENIAQVRNVVIYPSGTDPAIVPVPVAGTLVAIKK